MFHNMRKKDISGTQLLHTIEDTLGKILPDGWRVSVKPKVRLHNVDLDATLRLRAPDRKVATFAVETKHKLDPRDAGRVVEQVRRAVFNPCCLQPRF